MRHNKSGKTNTEQKAHFSQQIAATAATITVLTGKKKNTKCDTQKLTRDCSSVVPDLERCMANDST